MLVLKKQRRLRQKVLAVLQVAGGKRAMVGETQDTNKESVLVGGQKYPLSSTTEGSEGLEKLLRDKLDSFSGEGLDRTVEVVSNVMLELLDEIIVARGSTGSNVVAVDEKLPKSRVDDVLRSELQKKEDW